MMMDQEMKDLARRIAVILAEFLGQEILIDMMIRQAVDDPDLFNVYLRDECEALGLDEDFYGQVVAMVKQEAEVMNKWT